jgi:cytochrome c553
MRGFAVMLGLCALLFTPVRADELADQVSVCTSCHGEKGVPVDASIPVIAGQQEGYLYLELRDFKGGQRHSDIMQSIAGSLERPQMKALAAYFAGQHWSDLRQAAATDAITHRAEIINGSAACKGCHGENYQGDSAIPRVAGQQADYLRATMLAFKTGERANNPWMTALLKTYSDDDIDTLAKYLAGL